MLSKKKQPKNKYKQKAKPKQKIPPPTPFKLISQTKSLKQKIITNYNKNSYVVNTIELAQLNTLLSNVSLQFIPYLFSKADLKIFINIFTKLKQHKEIAICIIIKIFQAYFYYDGSINHQIQQKNQDILEQINNYYNLADFCLTLNSKQSNPVLYKTLIYSLGKLQKWCNLIANYKKISQQIKIYLIENYKDEITQKIL